MEKVIKDEVETVLFRDIKTPTTVEGFRENLRKYYCQYGEDFKEIYVKEVHCVNQEYVLIDELNSLDDLYKFHHRPNISPFVVWKMKDVNKFMYENGQFNSCEGFWDDESRFTIYTNQRDFYKDKNSSWVTIDNQILREFYIKTLGEFSGY